MSNNSPIETLSRDERVARFGLDCGNVLEWRSWEPGGEYVKNLVIKNVATQTQKIRYKLPQTKFFGMNFPETITLSAGMSCTFKVTFRPIELNRYDDYITFTCNGGSFNVPIRATLPSVGVVFTPKDCLLDFGVGSVGETQIQKLSILNTGEVPFNYLLSLPEADLPFKVTPTQGTLAPQETATLTLSFMPREAASYAITAVCNFSGIQRSINIRAISKYSFIVTDTNLLSFGDVLVGRTQERVLSVRNLSQVKTSIKIRRVESDCDPAFTFSTTSAKLGPGDTTSFKVTYAAATSGLYSSDTYELLTPGGNTVTVRCSGNAVGPCLVPNATAFNFGSITVGTTARRVLTLTSQSDTPSFFQFFTPDASDGACSPAFIIEPLQGTVPARGNVSVALTFTPATPITFYKRLVCLVRSGNPIWVDLVATAFDDTTRPAPLMQRHVDRFYARRIRANGLTTYPPETIEAIELPAEERARDEELEVSGEMSREIAATDPWEVFYYQNTHFSNVEIEDTSKVGLGLFGVKEVEVLESFVDFGACPKFPTSSKTQNVPKIEPKIIRVANRTNGKLSVVWSVSKSPEQAIFRVEPPAEDIAPHSIQYFRIHFQPRAANQFYGARLECYAYYKTMRNFRLVVEKSITPPWCFFTTVAGHTYEQGGETFLPRVELGSNKIGFTSCHVGGATHQIVSITNTGDTSLSYKFEFPTGSVFSCHPSRGVLRQEQTNLIVFRFRPTSLMTFRQVARCVLNNSPSNSIPVALVGTPSIASVSFPELLDDFDDMTKANGSDESEPSSAPLSKMQSQQSLNPSALSSAVTTPHSTSPSPSILKSKASTSGPPPSSLYFRLTCVGTITRRSFVVRNPSRIPVSFLVTIPEKCRDVFSVDPPEGEMLGNETVTLNCSFAPAKAKKYVIKVSFSVTAKSSFAKSEARAIPLTVVGEGVIGRLELDSRRIDFGNVLIGAATRREVVIRNATPCDVQYSLEWRLPNGQIPDSAAVFGPSEVWDLTDDSSDDSEDGDDVMTDIVTNDGDNDARQAPPGTPSTFRIKKFPVLEIVPASGFIPAYSTTTASVVIRPRGPALLTYKIICLLQYEMATPNGPPPLTQTTECEVIGSGVFPFLQVADVRSESLCRTAIWRWFNINTFNSLIADTAPAPGPNSSERSLSATSSLATLRPNSVPATPLPGTPRKANGVRKGRDFVRMDFGAAPVGSAPTRVVFAISNPSPLPVSWRFSFRSELEAYYAQKREAWMTMSMMDDEVSENMKRQKWMVENKIFRIKPKSGNLVPGATAFVEISYAHSVVTDVANTKGFDDLPVFFEIINGRHAVVRLRGRTLAPLERYLHFATSSHIFSPIPIGILDPPVQPYRLFNHGDVDVDFSFDLSALETMKKDNYNFSIFECLTPSGHIPAGGQFTSYWRFTPLEVKEYDCRVALHTKSGPTAHIMFCGRGYHPTGNTDLELEELNLYILPPPQPQLTLESQPLSLSLELLDLGTIPVHSVTRRLVVLHNSSNYPATFTWTPQSAILPPPLDSSSHPPAVEVIPVSATLAPDERRACCVVMRPGPHIGYFELDIPCVVTYTNPNAPTPRRKGEQGEVLAQNAGGSPPKHARREAASSRAEARHGSGATRRESSGLFPPIARAQPAQPAPPPQPQPPQLPLPPTRDLSHSNNGITLTTSTTKLFLVIKTRTIPTQQYRHAHGNYAVVHTPYPQKSSHSHNNPPQPQRISQVATQKSQRLPLSEEESASLRPIATDFLSSLISEILADPDVQEEARQHDDDEIIPYFEQLRDESERPDSANEDKGREQETARSKDSKHKIEKSNSFKISHSLRNLYAATSKPTTPTTPKRHKFTPLDGDKQHKFETILDVYKESEFSELAEYILEGTIYNLMNEVLHGDFSLDAPPATVFPSSQVERYGEV